MLKTYTKVISTIQPDNRKLKIIQSINPFAPNVPIVYLLKTSKDLLVF